MNTKHTNDEIDLNDLVLVIWKEKWKIVFISLIILALTIAYQLNLKPSKIVATTEIRPISVFDEAKYKIYNALTKEVTFDGKRSFQDVEISDDIEKKKYFFRDQNIVNITDLKIKNLDINNVNKEFLFELFLENIESISSLTESVKKFNFIKKEDFPNLEEYENAIADLTSSITFKRNAGSENKKSIDTEFSPIVVQFKGYDVKNWEKFLKFIEKETNLKIQKELSEMFTNYIELVKTIRGFELEDIDAEISTASSQKEKNFLERKKNFIDQNKYIERMQYIFSNSPISDSEEFYAAKIIYDSTAYNTKKKTSLKKMLMVGGIFGLILGILYVLLVNAIKSRR